MKIAIILSLFLAFIAQYVVGDCCARKPNAGCCGNGPCNIFCCNCDNGCNKACETGCCNTVDYLSCAGSIAAAVAKCAGIRSCVEGILGIGSACYKCYIGCDSGARLSEVETFASYAKDNLEKGAPHIDLSSLTHATPAQLAEAAKHDTDGDGHLNLAEFMSYNKDSAIKTHTASQCH
eukprot:gene8242-8912_t